MAAEIPGSAQVVIIGGGAIGTSIAYHLGKLGCTDAVLLERSQLTSGTTWHAAGLFMQLRTTHTMTELCRYGAELFPKLEQETGLSTGFRRVGSLPVARTKERLHEIARLITLGKAFNVEAHMVSPREAKELFPLLNPDAFVGAAFIPGDGTINPVDLTSAFAKGARMSGIRICEGVEVLDFEKQGDTMTAVVTSQGVIRCEKVVVCCGLWTRELAAKVGVGVPLYAAAHMYVTTEAHASIPKTLPVLRDTDGYNYIKEDAGKLVVGAFEPDAIPLSTRDLPANQSFIELPENWEQFELPMTKAIEAVPLVESLGVRHFMNGPESFTSDNRFILGEAPSVKNFFVAAGFNSQGILASPGVGKVMAEWITHRRPDIDLADLDIARFTGYETNERFLRDRISESLGLLYEMHWPHRQFESARQVRRTPLYEQLKVRNACFGTAAGVERANWYAPQGVVPKYEYSYGRQNWFDVVSEEHKAARESVAIFDLSTFGKTLVQGRDACEFLNRVAASEQNRAVGSVIYSQMLNENGGIMSDLTFTRLAKDKYLAVTAAAAQSRDFNWLKEHIGGDEFVTLTDVTAGFGTIAVTGPRARELMQRVSDADFSNEAFPFGTAKEIFVGYGKALALRVSYVGELGWELYPSTDYVGPIFEALLEAGADLGVKLAGYHALDSLRCEKGFVHWGHDVTPTDSPIQAGLDFAVSKKKSTFIGSSAIQRQRAEGVDRRLARFLLDSPEPILQHDEVIYRNGVIVGRITSGNFGYTLGRSVGLGYVDVPRENWKDFIEEGVYEIEIAEDKFSARASIAPFYDPNFTRPKA
ncbi:GcvT family protein [Burkholderia cenocepacia]|uniref:GcvT family protein n=1 Tax=Burkholderia cenocepacia TaxID=95486 RepID=UPI00264D79C4|nr:FAD-dependent oxidoreductase [Burkholderia cenocepacia]MDN7683142.1 FAD-dependent oxidoreductase [Burkholderia cenocepacia]